MMRALAIVGARQHAKVVWATVQDALADQWRVVAFLDDDSRLHGGTLLGVPILGPVAELEGLARKGQVQGALVGVSCGHMPARARLHGWIRELGLERPIAVSPGAFVHRLAKIGPGSVVCPGAVVHAFATVGDNCVLYSSCAVEHECRLEDDVYLGPGVQFCAEVCVGTRTFVGTGASVICPRVGTDVIVGAGAAVVHDVPDGAVVAGVPARVLRVRTPEERLRSYALR